MNFKSFCLALITLLFFKSDFSIASAEDNRSLQSSNYRTNLDKINLFDGSKLSGQLIQLDNNRNLLWKNDSIIGKINFDFDSVSNIFLNRSDTNLTTPSKAKKSIRLHLTNGDQFLASLKKISETEIMTDTEFTGLINLPIQAVEKIEFLPSSYSILYDSSQGLKEWKKSNSKSDAFIYLSIYVYLSLSLYFFLHFFSHEYIKQVDFRQKLKFWKILSIVLCTKKYYFRRTTTNRSKHVDFKQKLALHFYELND